MSANTFGQHLAVYRRRRGLSQAALAGLIGRSESWLSQVERGLRTVDRWSLLTELASVLRVPVEALTGTAIPAAKVGATPDGLAVLQRFFTDHATLTGRESPLSSMPSAHEQVRLAHRNYQAGRYERLIDDLPATLLSAEAARSNDESAAHDRVSAYVVAAKLLTKVGAGTFALLAADRSATAAQELESATMKGTAAYQVACALALIGRPDDAEILAVRMAEQTQCRKPRPSTLAQASVAGSLWLIAAVLAGRRYDRHEAAARLENAQRLAHQLGSDANHAWTAFGPTNVTIHRVSIAAGLGDAREAIREAAKVDFDDFPSGLTGRRARVHLDLGSAHAQRRNQADALLHLLEAERRSPESIRYHATFHRVIRDMLARTTPSTASALHGLAVRAGVLN
jgi:transcriptional regulator with XRE-family HTH domain